MHSFRKWASRAVGKFSISPSQSWPSSIRLARDCHQAVHRCSFLPEAILQMAIWQVPLHDILLPPLQVSPSLLPRLHFTGNLLWALTTSSKSTVLCTIHCQIWINAMSVQMEFSSRAMLLWRKVRVILAHFPKPMHRYFPLSVAWHQIP